MSDTRDTLNINRRPSDATFTDGSRRTGSNSMIIGIVIAALVAMALLFFLFGGNATSVAPAGNSATVQTPAGAASTPAAPGAPMQLAPAAAPTPTPVR